MGIAIEQGDALARLLVTTIVVRIVRETLQALRHCCLSSGIEPRQLALLPVKSSRGQIAGRSSAVGY